VRTVEREITTADKGFGVQLGFLAGPFAGLLDLTALMIEVAEQADATLADVRRSAELFAQFQEELTPYKQVLDLWVSRFFGNRAAEEFLAVQGGEVLPALKGEREVEAKYQAAIEEARRLWREKRFFHWDLEFPEVFVDLHKRDWAENPGFDAVIGNPPYGIVFDIPEKNYIEETFPSFIRNNDLYAAFAEGGTGLLQSNGLTAMIVPNTFIMGPYFNRLKQYWLDVAQVVFIDDFGYTTLFPDPNVFSAIYLCRKDEAGCTRETSLRDACVLDSRVRYLDVHNALLPSLPLERWKPFSPVTQKAFGNSLALGDLCVVKDVGFNYWTKGRGKRRGGSIGSRVLYNGPQEHLDDIPFLKGSDFSRYEDPTPGMHWLRHDYEELLDPDTDVFRFSAEFLRVPTKIVYRQTSDTIIAALDLARHLVDKTVHVVLLREDFCSYSYKYLLAILNSGLTEYVYNDLAKEEGRAFAQVKIFRVRQLPIRRIEFTTPAAERERYVQELVEASDRHLSGAGHLDLVAQHLAAGRSDVVHDLLAHLAEQMIDMNRQKQRHLRAFRLDLAGYLDEAQQKKLNRLYTPKKPPRQGIQHYDRRLAAYERAVAEAQAQLGSLATETLNLDDFWRLDEGQWMWVLRQRLGRVGGMSDLVALHATHRAPLAPLMSRLRRTDDLIDQVVYRLYGLTEKEIAVVEQL